MAGCRLVCAPGIAAHGGVPDHFATDLRFCGKGVRGPDALGTARLEVVLPIVPRGPLVVVVDDTLARKTGKNIWGANLHRDPLAWLPNALAFGHNWVVLAIVIHVPLVKRPVAVPVLLRLYRSKKARTGKTPRGKRERKTTGTTPANDHPTLPQLAGRLLPVLPNASTS